MSLSIAPAAYPASLISSPAAASNTGQQVQLNQLVSQYSAGISQNIGTGELDTLARQIATAAAALGQIVTLPTGIGPGDVPPTPAEATARAGNVGAVGSTLNRNV
jgi:hypothetical protein